MSDAQAELQRKELQQNTHYFYLNQLQSMSRELPGKYQQRLPYDLLNSLASCLLDGTAFDIVASLREVQQLEERNLSNQRVKLDNEIKVRRQDLLKKHREIMQLCSSKPHNLPYAQQQCRQELESFDTQCDCERKRRDMKIILELDQKVMEQQSMLEKAGIPGILVTNNPLEIRLQMYLLDFIGRLSQMAVPSS